MAYHKHGLTKQGGNHHPLYKIWKNMIRRCYDPSVNGYEHYGGKPNNPISVCDEWRNDVSLFVKWAIEYGNYKEGLQIDRKDNDGNYEPSNCIFVTKKENTRKRSTSRFVTIGDETKTIAEWSEISGIKYTTMHERWKRGWSGFDLLKPTKTI